LAVQESLDLATEIPNRIMPLDVSRYHINAHLFADFGLNSAVEYYSSKAASDK
jgi:hypothetical protein